MRKWCAILIAIAWHAFPHAAAAQALQQQLSGFGLLGKWAVHCGQPADAGNGHATYAMTSKERAELRYDFGPKNAGRSYTITAARRLAPDQLEIDHHDNPDGVPHKTVIRKAGNRIQNVSAVEPLTGKVWISNGIMSLNGAPAPWLEACR